MKHHRVKETISRETRETLLTQIQELTNAMPVLVSVPDGQRKRMAKMGLRSRPFVEDAIKLATEHSDILPRTYEPAGLRAKLETVENLRDIAAAVETLSSKLSESLMVAGAELYEDARLIYTLVKTGVRPAGLEPARAKLKQRFKGGGGQKAPEQPAEEVPQAA
ncbi:MAG: hypothetical protein SFU53_01590 [Terrimicrobiaceae bacterium]|nr:hypothetical protein [Terrimicrobiaceae bacterium]